MTVHAAVPARTHLLTGPCGACRRRRRTGSPGAAQAPSLTIERPDRVVGRTGEVAIVAGAPGGRLTLADDRARAERQGDSRCSRWMRPRRRRSTQVDGDRIRVTRPIGKQSVPELQAGAARIVVSATRPSFLNLRTLSSTASKDFQVRLEPPRLARPVDAPLRQPRRIGDGRLRATPPDVASGVRVGDGRVPRVSGGGRGRRRRRPLAEGRVLRPAARSAI